MSELMCSIQYDVSHEWGCDFPNVFFTLPVGSSASVLFWPFYPITCVIMSYTKSPDHIISLLKPISLTCQELKWRKKLPNAFECSLSISNITQCTQWHVITTPPKKKTLQKTPRNSCLFASDMGNYDRIIHFEMRTDVATEAASREGKEKEKRIINSNNR